MKIQDVTGFGTRGTYSASNFSGIRKIFNRIRKSQILRKYHKNWESIIFK